MAAAKKKSARSTATPRKRAARPAPKRRVTAAAAPAAARKKAKTAGAPPAPPSAGAATIVYVHGIGNKPLASVLKGQWDSALFEFDLGERTRMAYWVDRERYPTPLDDVSSGGDYADATEDAPTGEFSGKTINTAWVPAQEVKNAETELTGFAVASEIAASDLAALRRIARTVATENKLTSDEEFAAAAAELRGQGGEEARRIQAQRYGAAAVRAKVFGFLPRPIRQWMTRKITHMLLRDVHDLFIDKAKGERMKQSLRDRLRAGGGPFVVVAHSQGTMIAYTVLMEDEFKDLDVPLLVTMGSPLGITEVQDYITQLTGRKKLTTPPPVRRWVNVADPLDPVALDKKLGSDYGPNAAGVKVKDEVSWNPDSLRHPHSATGYLALGDVRQPVREAVDTGLFQPVARFKIAKDVVRDFADAMPEDRHRILVQLEDFATTSMQRNDSLKRIYEILGATDESSDAWKRLAPEELYRYVALNLTREEAEKLGSRASGDRKFPVARIWKNSAKWALVDKSIHTTQAFPAHNSYRAFGADVTWAVLDSGIKVNHPHFANGTIKQMYDCTRPSQRRGREPLRALDANVEADRKAIDDRFGHGAHVAGIIAGRHTVKDAEGKERVMSGMSPETKLVIYKVLDNNGSGEDSWIIKALDHIWETNENAGKVVIHGVNLSLGGEFDVEAFNCGQTPLCVELRRLWRQGVVVVLAAGNEGFASLSTADGSAIQANMGMSLGDPANLEEAITVGSVHKDSPHTYGLSYFSSRGPTADGRMKPDCVAPGERIYSVRNDAVIGTTATFEQLYAEMSGTSMAAPHVSGLLAAFLSRRQEFMGRPDDVKSILLRNCTDLGRQPQMQGAGMPNLVKMLVNV